MPLSVRESLRWRSGIRILTISANHLNLKIIKLILNRCSSSCDCNRNVHAASRDVNEEKHDEWSMITAILAGEHNHYKTGCLHRTGWPTPCQLPRHVSASLAPPCHWNVILYLMSVDKGRDASHTCRRRRSAQYLSSRSIQCRLEYSREWKKIQNSACSPVKNYRYS